MLIRQESAGLYCEKGDFYIDPSRGVERAIITHAHSDHARRGSKQYLCSTSCAPLLTRRLGRGIVCQHLDEGTSIDIQGVRVSFHPAGHILGSCQVRIESNGEVWVVSGDYKLQSDPTCSAFEPIRCHTFISECTFGNPIYRWPDPSHEWARLLAWWQRNRDAGRLSLLRAYSLGKSQRILSALADTPIRWIVHPSIEEMLPAYHEQGVSLPKVTKADSATLASAQPHHLILSPSSPTLEASLGGIGDREWADVSGWCLVGGPRRRRNQSTGFVVSDHADWDGLNQAIRASSAERVLLTHGDTKMLARWLQEQGIQAQSLESVHR